MGIIRDLFKNIYPNDTNPSFEIILQKLIDKEIEIVKLKAELEVFKRAERDKEKQRLYDEEERKRNVRKDRENAERARKRDSYFLKW